MFENFVIVLTYINRGYCGLKVGFKPNLRSLDHIFLCVWWISGKWAGFHFQGLGSRPDRVTVVFDSTHNSPSATLHLGVSIGTGELTEK